MLARLVRRALYRPRPSFSVLSWRPLGVASRWYQFFVLYGSHLTRPLSSYASFRRALPSLGRCVHCPPFLSDAEFSVPVTQR